MSNLTDDQALSQEHVVANQPLTSAPRSDPTTQSTTGAKYSTDADMHALVDEEGIIIDAAVFYEPGEVEVARTRFSVSRSSLCHCGTPRHVTFLRVGSVVKVNRNRGM